MKIILYVLCPNPEALDLTKQKYKGFEWAFPILMPPLNKDIPIFENKVYELLGEKERQEEWETADFVGTLSWNFEKKISIKSVQDAFENKCNFDFVPFFVHKNRSALNSGISNHGDYFGLAWSYLKERTGLSSHQIHNEVVECASNYWMCRPKFMIDYIAWHRQLLKYAKEKMDIFSVDAFYPAGKLSKQDLFTIWGKPFYPLLPFVFERFSTMFFANYAIYCNNNKPCLIENSLIVPENNNNTVSTIKRYSIFCVGNRIEDFIDIKHNAYPFIHHDSEMYFKSASPQTEMQAIRLLLSAYAEECKVNDMFFLFTGPIRVLCSWKKLIHVLNAPTTPFSDFYYLGFAPLSDDATLWSYNNLITYPCEEGEACKLNKVVYGGGIAFRKTFWDELVTSTDYGTLSDFLWKRKTLSFGIFPQFVIPHYESNEESSLQKFCNPKFSSFNQYCKSIGWYGWLPS